MLEKTTTATTATERVALSARDVELGLEEAAGLACKHFRWLRKLMRPDMLHDWATDELAPAGEARPDRRPDLIFNCESIYFDLLEPPFVGRGRFPNGAR
jgi:hypothetical protein